MPRNGLIQIYTGNVDATRFPPMGLSLRGAGHNFRTYMTDFIPHPFRAGAETAAQILKPNLIFDWGEITSLAERDWDEAQKAEARRMFQRAIAALQDGKFDMVILNGILHMCHHGVISHDQVLQLMTIKPTHVELVLTGPFASDALTEGAHLVTEVVHHSGSQESEMDPQAADTAPTEVVTGNGKGKTTYCLGKALLMSCMGIRTAFLQFIKSPKAYGEIKAAVKLPLLQIKTMGEGFLNIQAAVSDKKHSEAAKRTWEECLKEIFSLQYGLVVLDEINIATYYGLIHAERVREMLFLKPRGLHLILSGRNAHLEVREGATSVIEMREIKHPFHQGIKARKGIEF
jgi:cob(I)alamin adenosyltransferase